MSSQTHASTRERILHIARDLIFARGFSAMSIDMICGQAGITKGGFFHHFPNKEALGEAVLQQFWQDALARQRQILESAYPTKLDQLAAYLEDAISTYQDPQFSQGCMLAIFTMGLAETNPRLFQVSQEYFQDWRGQLIDMLSQVKEEQHLAAFDETAWAELYIATLEGALLLAKAMGDTKVTARTLSLYKQQLLAAATQPTMANTSSPQKN
ncbi:TetR/AcrR family transcriptional regulator [Methylobacillus flagellatus]|uniref:Transcriptional regulator, TetR family n=1 Tax=Methylobacillus flagellatus (strain ATCC 51484 / DSM 6875 / VKM B-1610 / KT) TaxID=265072 RepID=Q1GY42_METFK|nr:TetR/AcrR family transcriptional regulator [Methylobacillus flagellatus]ABE50845.1 transcriptional regulator, TetR family [Methylobacillus flagellatus KT]